MEHLVEKLRMYGNKRENDATCGPVMMAAADEIERSRAALRLHKAWVDAETAGPDYGGQSRDTHPDGEKIWRSWWDNQLDLCERANDATNAIISKVETEAKK